MSKITKKTTTKYLMALIVALVTIPVFAQSPKNKQDDKRENGAAKIAARSVIDLELLSRAEQRADNLRAKSFEMQMREVELRARIAELEYQLRPESIQRAFAFVGSVRPMDELRDGLRGRLEGEKTRLTQQLEVLVTSRERLEASIKTADAEVDRLRQRVNVP
jgi:hypothetical protein